MASTFGARLKHAWNAFKRDTNELVKADYRDIGQSFMYRPDRLHLTRGPDKTIIASIYNRIAMDVAAVKIEHVKLDDEGRYLHTINSPLNKCLSVEANIDQTGRTFIQDAVLTMLDNGCVAMVPTSTDINPTTKDEPTFDVLSMRNATIKQWYPRHVQVDIYNEVTGLHSQYTLPKSMLAIVENPFYPIMNEPNSTMQRLIRKLTILDAIDEQTGSGKLDMIIQLPYVIKSPERRKQAEIRRKDLENQLAESKYGVAYADGTEKIIQLNRPLENNLLSTIEYLTSMLYSQLGISTGILDGSADEQTMLNYNNRIVEPILSVLADEMKRKFLTKTARSQHQSIKFFIQPFRALPISNVADLANSLARNEIVTANEFRQILGMKPADNPNADELRNANMPAKDQMQQMMPAEMPLSEDPLQAADELDTELDELEELLNHTALQHYLPTPAKYASPYYDPEKAHEYYMRNRQLKERKSTTSLNERGQEVAQYVQKQINDERDKKLLENDLSYEDRLQAIKDQKVTDTQTNNDYANTRLETAKGTRDTRLDRITSNTKSELNTLKSQKEEQVKQSQTRMKSSIDSLKRQLNSMTSVQKSKNRGKIQEQIDKLREENAVEKEKLYADYEKDTDKVKTKSAEDKKGARTEYSIDTNEARSDRKIIQEVINENYSKSVSELKAETKNKKSAIGEEYTEKWLSELDKIKSNSEYIKPPKTQKAKQSPKAKQSTKKKNRQYTPFWWK